MGSIFFRPITLKDEDVEKIRLHTVSEARDLDSLEKMVDGLDAEDPKSMHTSLKMGLVFPAEATKLATITDLTTSSEQTVF